MSTDMAEKSHIAAESLNEALQASGLLVHKEGSGHLDFQFLYLDYPFSVRAQSVDNVTSINIRTFLGHLPYSSESRLGRIAATKILSMINKKLGLDINLTQNQKLMLSGNITSEESLSPVNLLTMVTTLLLQAKPMLILLSEYIKPIGEFEELVDNTRGITHTKEQLVLN